MAPSEQLLLAGRVPPSLRTLLEREPRRVASALSDLAGMLVADGLPPGAVYLSVGDSAATDLPDRSVDAVVTDPPFFDNVHYSELADFFHVWQRLWLDDGDGPRIETTGCEHEVQDTDCTRFSDKLSAVFGECHKVSERWERFVGAASSRDSARAATVAAGSRSHGLT